jgi:Glycosyl transferases group 1
MKICFVAPHIYPLIAGLQNYTQIGGAELQQTMIARGMVEKGLDVSIITLDHGQPFLTDFNGIRVIKTFKSHEGILGLRFFYPRLFKIIKALTVANADIYYVRCASYLVGIVTLFGKLFNKKVIYAAGHDTDFIPGNYLIALKRDKFLYEMGLKRVYRIIVQTNQQMHLLSDNFGKDGELVRNFTSQQAKQIDFEHRNITLWVSTIREWKRPMLFLELAKKYPNKKFVMIGGPAAGNEDLYKQIKSKAESIDNLELKGFLPLNITEEYFDQCAVFVNTSINEGFPNTYIQAWRRGIPCLSFFDPDNVINTFSLGQTAKTEDDFFSKYITTSEMSKTHTNKIIEYFNANHSDLVLEKYYSLFTSLHKNSL